MHFLPTYFLFNQTHAEVNTVTVNMLIKILYSRDCKLDIFNSIKKELENETLVQKKNLINSAFNKSND